MAWIKIDVNLRENKKIRKLSGLTGWNIYECVGRIANIWCWCLKNQEDGNLSKLEPLEYLDDVKGDFSAPVLENYLIESGLIDKNPKLIHDWLDYADRYLIRKYQSSNLDKLKKIWKLHGREYGK